MSMTFAAVTSSVVASTTAFTTTTATSNSTVSAVSLLDLISTVLKSSVPKVSAKLKVYINR